MTRADPHSVQMAAMRTCVTMDLHRVSLTRLAAFPDLHYVQEEARTYLETIRTELDYLERTLDTEGIRDA